MADSIPSIHSCLYIQAENERIIAKYKRLKARYNELENRHKKSEEKSSSDTEVKCGAYANKSTQTNVEKTEQEVNKQSVKLLQSHANLAKKYEKELEYNTRNAETIATLTIANSKLETQLKQSREKEHTVNVQLTKFQSETQRKLNKIKDEKFKATAEKDSLQYELQKLKAEVKGIDQNFFDEIEDLKYALQESAKLNAVYEKTLRHICRQHKLSYDNVLSNMANKYQNKRN